MSHSWGGSVYRYLMIAEDYKGKWWDQSENKKRRVSLFFLFSPSNPYFYLFINYPNYFALILVNWAHSKKTFYYTVIQWIRLLSDPPLSLRRQVEQNQASKKLHTVEAITELITLLHIPERGNLITLNTKICLKLKVSFDLKVVNIF